MKNTLRNDLKRSVNINKVKKIYETINTRSDSLDRTIRNSKLLNNSFKSINYGKIKNDIQIIITLNAEGIKSINQIKPKNAIELIAINIAKKEYEALNSELCKIFIANKNNGYQQDFHDDITYNLPYLLELNERGFRFLKIFFQN